MPGAHARPRTQVPRRGPRAGSPRAPPRAATELARTRLGHLSADDEAAIRALSDDDVLALKIGLDRVRRSKQARARSGDHSIQPSSSPAPRSPTLTTSPGQPIDALHSTRCVSPYIWASAGSGLRPSTLPGWQARLDAPRLAEVTIRQR